MNQTTTIGERYLLITNYMESTVDALAKLIDDIINSQDKNLEAHKKPTALTLEQLQTYKKDVMSTYMLLKLEKQELGEKLRENNYDYKEAYNVPDKYKI